MKVTFIEDEVRDDIIVFFPESYRFFKAKRIVKEVISSYINGVSKEEISEICKISYEQVQEVISKAENSAMIVDNNKFDMKVKSFENTLEKLVINVTGRCNMKCKYCYEQMGEKFEEENNISFDTIDRIFEVITKKYNRIEHVQFFGGEAFLNLDAIEYICKKFKSLYENNIICNLPQYGVVSNGTIMNDKVIEIIEKYNISVTVSFDGMPTVHDKVRVFDKNEKSSDLIVKNIKRLKENSNANVAVQVTYNKEHNIEKVKMIDIMKYLGEEFNTKNVHITPVICDKEDDLYLDDLSEFVSSIDDLFKDKGLNVYPDLVYRFIISLVKKNRLKVLCSAGIGQLSISSTGDIYPCFMLIGTTKYKLGNVYDENVLEQKDFIDISNTFKTQFKTKINKCKDCFLINVCNSCVGANNIINKSAFEPIDDICEMNKRMFTKILFNLAEKPELRA